MGEPAVADGHARGGHLLERLIHGLSAVLGALAALAVLGLLAISTIDVGSRQVRDQGVGGAVEYGEVLLVLLTLLSLGVAFRHGTHVSADFATRRMPPRTSAVAQAIGLAVVIGVLIVLVWESADVAIDSVKTGEYRMGIVRAPLWPARLAVPLGFGALLLEMSVVFAGHVRVALGPTTVHVSRPDPEDGGRGLI